MPAEKFVAEVWSELAIALACVSLRYYARITTLGWRNLALDDVFMAGAAVRSISTRML